MMKWSRLQYKRAMVIINGDFQAFFMIQKIHEKMAIESICQALTICQMFC